MREGYVHKQARATRQNVKYPSNAKPRGTIDSSDNMALNLRIQQIIHFSMST